MRPAVRLAAVLIGLAATAYGTASLTGGWLGTPPWWTMSNGGVGLVLLSDGRCVRRETHEEACHEPRSSDVPVGGTVVAAGVALGAFGAWPRRASGSP